MLSPSLKKYSFLWWIDFQHFKRRQPITAALSFLFQSKKNKRETKRELSTQDKKELEKINEMGMFEAMNYLAEREEKITYCGACGGDASECDGC